MAPLPISMARTRLIVATPRFRFVNVVWGASFTDAFLRVCLPSQLTPRNLPAFASGTASSHWIYTTSEFVETIKRSDSYQKLAAIMPVKLAVISGISRAGKYQAMNQCHAHFIKSAADEDCSMIFQTPDIAWSEGSFERLREVYDRGVRNVAIGSLRLTKETFVPALLRQYGKDGILQALSSRELVTLALQHLHPVTKAQRWDEANDTSFVQGQMYWSVSHEGLIARQFRLQPLMVTPADRHYVPAITFDADFTDQVCRNPADWYVVTDSDDMCYVDFTPVAYGTRYGDCIKPARPTVQEEAAWAKSNALAIHRHFVTQAFRIHAGECSDAWTDVERQSDVVIRDILALTERDGDGAVMPPPLSPGRYLSPQFWFAKLQRQGAVGLAGEIWSRGRTAFLRRLWGPDIIIRMVQ